MKSQRKRLIALIVVGAAAAALAAVYAEDAFLWYRKRQAWSKVSSYPPRERATLNSVLADEVRALATPVSGLQRISCEVNGYRFSFPAAEFRRTADANDGFDGAKVTLRCLGVAPRTADLQAEYQPSSEAVAAYLAQSDPYDLLVEAFRTSPADISMQTTGDGLQKVLYLLFLKSAYQPVGSEKLFERFQANGRKGVLAGDHTCETLVVLLYLPETREFAELVIGNKGLADMAPVYRCLGLLTVRRAEGKQPPPPNAGK